MAAAISIPGPLTRADLGSLPDDGRRFELIDGALLVSPIARRRHQRVVTRLATELELWTREHGGTAYAGVNVDLDDHTHLEPDVAWSRSEDDSGLGFATPPELVVEVSSPSTRAFDRGIKRAAYLAAGVAEVWLIDLDTDVVERHALGDDGGPVVHRRGEHVSTPLLAGFRVSVDGVLGPPTA